MTKYENIQKATIEALKDGNENKKNALRSVINRIKNYAIDFRYQNQGFGFKALKELIEFLKTEYDCKLITTTYKIGNEIACGLYKKVGFKERDVVDDGDIKEVNMQLEC